MTDVTVDRIGGADRYETASLIARATFGPDSLNGQTTDTAVLARGDDFADALSGNGLAGAIDATVLLTQRDNLPDTTVDALGDLGITNVVILGQTAAVSASVEAELRALGFDVSRIGGANRYETSALIARALPEIGLAPNIAAPGDNVAPGTPAPGGATPVATPGADGLVTGIIARGDDFADALSGGPLAYKGSYPVFLVQPTDSPDVITDAIEDLGIEQLFILGGPAAVGQAPADEVDDDDTDTFRIAGGDRFGTAENFARFLVRFFGEPVPLGTVQAAQVGTPDEGFDADDETDARGDDFADALAGAQFSALIGAPILLVQPNVLPQSTRDYLDDFSFAIQTITIYGGPAAISDAVAAAKEAAAENVGNDEMVTNPPAPPAQPTDLCPTGVFPAATVTTVNNAGDFFTVTTGGTTVPGATPVATPVTPVTTCTLTFDGGDAFALNGQPITPEQFEALLSTGDVLDVLFFRDPNGVSVFDIVSNVTPPAGTTPPPGGGGTTPPPPADTTGPTLVDSRVLTDLGTVATAGAGDVLQFTFSEPIAQPADGDGFTLTDADGTLADVVCGVNATCVLNAAPVTTTTGQLLAGQQLTVTFTEVPGLPVAGTVPGLQFPATVNDILGITDLAGNAALPTGDVVVDQEILAL